MKLNRTYNFFKAARRELIPSFPIFIFSLLLLGLVIALAVSYVSHERYIYFWDSANYFNYFSELGHKLTVMPLNAIDGIFVSIRKADYNLSGVVPILPFYYVFGPGRMSYIGAIAVTYVFPLILFFPFLMRTIEGRRSKESGRDVLLFVLLTLSIALMPQMWVPVFLGYIDVAGVLIIFCIFYLYFRVEFNLQPTRWLVAIGGLLSLLVIVRRWYAYWVVGFFLAVTVQHAFEMAASDNRKKSGRIFLKNIAVVGLTSGLTFFVLATQIGIRMLKTNYADIYSAYKSEGGFSVQIVRFVDHFGWFALTLVAAGIVAGFALKPLRKQTLFLTVLFATTLLIFLRTQDLDYQHYNWIIPIFAGFAGIFLVELYKWLQRPVWRAGIVAAFVLLWAANFAVVFVPKAEQPLAPAKILLSTTRLPPKVRNDVAEIERLLTTLNTELRSPDSKAYILSSSLSLNSGLLHTASYAFGPELRPVRQNLLQTNNVDKRDGFPFQMYSADLVVVADPVGYHLRPEDQKVVGILAGYILSGTSIGAAYTRLPYEFKLDEGYRVYLYRKNRGFQPDELMQVSDQFVALYPDHSAQFAIDDAMLAKYRQ